MDSPGEGNNPRTASANKPDSEPRREVVPESWKADMIECSACGWRHTVPCGRDDCPHDADTHTPVPDLLCPKCDGITVEHTLNRMRELEAENDRLRARIVFWRREYGAHGSLSGETLTEMDVAGTSV